MAKFVEESVAEALERSIRNATHLRARHAAAIAAARALARKIDAWDLIVEWANDDAADDGGRPKVPANDNVSIASFLKYLDTLGLVPEDEAPAGRGASVPAPPKNDIAAMRKKLGRSG